MKVFEARERISQIETLQQALSIRIEHDEQPFHRDCDELCKKLLLEYKEILQKKIEESIEQAELL